MGGERRLRVQRRAHRGAARDRRWRPGDLSLDHALGLDEAGAKLALAVLAAGAAGSAIVVAAARRQPAPDEAVYPAAA